MQDMIKASNNVMDAVSFHHYYWPAAIATIDDYLSTVRLDQLGEIVEGFKRHLPNIDLWMTETGSAYGHGGKGILDRFVATFMWLDKLGMVASRGVKLLVHQTLYNGDYSFIEKDTYMARPDLWISILYKRLVSTQVLDVKTAAGFPSTLRLYAHCAKNKKGHITLFGLNMVNATKSFDLANNNVGDIIEQYEMTANGNDILSKYMDLNGQIVNYPDENHFPDLMRPKQVKGFNMQPYSLSFWTVPMTGGIC